jgi:hypothetical protein
MLGPLLGGHRPNRQRSVVDLSLHLSQLVPAALLGALSYGLHLISIVSASPGRRVDQTTACNRRPVAAPDAPNAADKLSA